MSSSVDFGERDTVFVNQTSSLPQRVSVFDSVFFIAKTSRLSARIGTKWDMLCLPGRGQNKRLFDLAGGIAAIYIRTGGKKVKNGANQMVTGKGHSSRIVECFSRGRIPRKLELPFR